MTKAIPKKVVNQEDVKSNSPHDFIFQFICAETGKRSEPFMSNWTELGKILDLRDKEDKDIKPTDSDYILLVAVMDKEQTHIPTAPLITVETYLNCVRPEK